MGAARLKYFQDGGTSGYPEVSVNFLILNRTPCILLHFWIPRKILGKFYA